MKKAVVTGAAGFVGSHLVDELVSQGWDVTGIDSFTDFYDVAIKEGNLSALRDSDHFTLVRGDLNEIDIAAIVDGADVVFHQAAQAGVRTSWGSEFEIYTSANVLATQKLLETCREKSVGRVVLASSSSVYGDTDTLPVTEDSPTRPYSPYGVTKLAAEHLGRLYCRNFGLSTVGLRYFTVYGPRQRPDMAFHRIIRSLLSGEEMKIFGSGDQTRDFTYVKDVVRANMLAAEAKAPSEVYNVGGGSRVSLNETIKTLEGIVGSKFKRNTSGRQKGDVKDTWSDGSRAEREIGFRTEVSLQEGLSLMVDWFRTVEAKEI